MRKYKVLMGIKKVVLVTLAIFFFGYLVMYLWNWLLPEIIGVSSITFTQALGLLILSRLLFGSFHRCHGGHHHQHGGAWRNKIRDKYRNMSGEERMKFREKFGRYCQDMSWVEDTSEENPEPGREETKN